MLIHHILDLHLQVASFDACRRHLLVIEFDGNLPVGSGEGERHRLYRACFYQGGMIRIYHLTIYHLTIYPLCGMLVEYIPATVLKGRNSHVLVAAINRVFLKRIVRHEACLVAMEAEMRAFK